MLLHENTIEIGNDLYELPRHKRLRVTGKYHVDTYGNRSIKIKILNDDVLYIEQRDEDVFGQPNTRRLLIETDGINGFEVNDVIIHPPIEGEDDIAEGF